MSDTPETDAVLARLVDNQSGNSCDAVVIHHARKLERERDEARKEIKELKFELALTVIPTTVEDVEREEWRQERDALRAEVERLKSDKARLDWLISVGIYSPPNDNHGMGDEYELSRDAIDAAMKGEL